MSFPQFCLLPKELQLKIWAFMLPGPRIVNIFAFPVEDRLEERLTPNSCTTDPLSTSWVHTRTERVFALARLSRLPTVFHVCRDSRELVLRHCTPFLCEPRRRGQREREVESLPPVAREADLEIVFSRTMLKRDRPFTLLDPRKDMIFLENPTIGSYLRLNGAEFLVRCTVETLMRWLSSDIKENLLYLAMSYSSWRAAIDNGTVKVLVQLRGLEVLYVAYSRGSVSASLGSSTPQVTPSVDDDYDDEDDDDEDYWRTTKCELVEEAMKTLKILSREHSQWKIPIVRIVYDRTEMKSDFERKLWP